MTRIWKGLVAVALAGSSFALYGTSTAGATGPGDSITVTVANKATYANKFRTAINVSGTYTCAIATGWTPDSNFSGINVGVSEIQGKVVVQGQGGVGGPDSGFPICDGNTYSWTAQVPAGIPGPGGGSGATWKSGKATVSGGGNVADGFDCGGPGGGGTSNCMGTQFTQTIKIG